MKILLILQILLLSLVFQTSSCYSQENAPVVKWKGNDDVNDLVFIIKKGTSYKQLEKFRNEVLSHPRADGSGYDLPDGVIETSDGGFGNGFEGGIVNFREEATKEQREKLKKAIESSPIIYKVWENAAPNKIDLPVSKTPEVNSTPDNRPNKKGEGEFKETVVSKNPYWDEVYDLVFVFKKNLLEEKRSEFAKRVFFTLRADGQGYEQDVFLDTRTVFKNKYDGLLINFRKEATKEQREKLKKAIESSPIVFKVWENVVPNKINDL